ncbi:MAG: hypothetical protein M0Z42_04450 [Actinomycetota bacterium]|nr:hypothetical protein [Actinomycetota bacterium]
MPLTLVAWDIQVTATQDSLVIQSSARTRPADAGRGRSAQVRPLFPVVTTTALGRMKLCTVPPWALTRAPTAQSRDVGQLKAVDVQALSGSSMERHVRP